MKIINYGLNKGNVASLQKKNEEIADLEKQIKNREKCKFLIHLLTLRCCFIKMVSNKIIIY